MNCLHVEGVTLEGTFLYPLKHWLLGQVRSSFWLRKKSLTRHFSILNNFMKRWASFLICKTLKVESRSAPRRHSVSTDLTSNLTVLLTSPVTSTALTFLPSLRVRLIPSLSTYSTPVPISTLLPSSSVHLPTSSTLALSSFLTLLLVSLSSAWDGIGVNNTPLPNTIPLSVPVSVVDFCCGAASLLSPAPACRCLWRRQSWQREGSNMLGWNLGQMGSSLETGIVGPERGPARSSHPTKKTGKQPQGKVQNHHEI